MFTTTKWIFIGHNFMQNPSGIYRSHQINEIWMCSDRKNDIIWGWLVNLALKSLVENYSWNRMIKKDILCCSSPRPSTTYLQAPKSTPDYFQAERSFSGNRQVILIKDCSFFLGRWLYFLLFFLLFMLFVTVWLLTLMIFFFWFSFYVNTFIISVHTAVLVKTRPVQIT